MEYIQNRRSFKARDLLPLAPMFQMIMQVPSGAYTRCSVLQGAKTSKGWGRIIRLDSSPWVSTWLTATCTDLFTSSEASKPFTWLPASMTVVLHYTVVLLMTKEGHRVHQTWRTVSSAGNRRNKAGLKCMEFEKCILTHLLLFLPYTA